MKKKFFLLVVVFICNWSQSQIVNIPDAYLKSQIIANNLGIDNNGDGEIQVSEALATTTLNACALSEDPTGLEAFVNLIQLNVDNNLFAAFDVSVYPNLESLSIRGNPITSLDVSMLSNLTTLNCSTCTSLSSLNFSGALNLQDINLTYTNLTSLNFTSLLNLTTLDCSYSNLNSLLINGLPNLTHLNCAVNSLTTINLSGLPNLQVLDCSDQQDSNYDSCLTALDVSGLSSLTALNCNNNLISTLDVGNLVNLSFLYCSRNLLQSLPIDNLTQLTTLDCSFNQIPTLNLTSLSNLTYLNCASYYLLPTINFSPLTNLTYLDCSYIPFVSLDVSNLTNLTTLHTVSCQLNNLNVTNLSNLTGLNCSNNLLTSIDLSSLVNLEILQCHYNELSALDFTNLTKLGDVYAAYNMLTSVDFSNYNNQSPTSNFATSLTVNNNPNLTYVNVKNGSGICYLQAMDCSSLIYVCANEASIPGIASQLGPNVQVNSYCSFSPSGVYNTITGTVTFDINNNGCEASDFNPANFKMQLFDGTDTGASFSNTMGEYLFYTQAGNFEITPQLQNPYFALTPATSLLTFPTVDGSTQIQDICVTPVGIHNDVEIAILPITPPRPGFDVDYRLTYTNKGNQLLSGSVNYTFDDTVLDFISATPTITSQSVNNLTWNYSNLSPFESRSIDIKLNLNGPTETPAVNIDDVVTCSATINPVSGDETPEDNTFELEEIVVGAYDPNDKTCLEGDTITPSQVGDYLHYLIRFQNSGTAPAVNVVVKDMIDTTKFDIASLQLTSASHPHITRIVNNKVEFIFENIQLPAEQDDEPGSHGFVAFKIKTKPNLVLGNTVSNTADIYFDYNFPIITNTTSTTVSNLGINEFENLSVSMTPNPVKDLLTIAADDVITSVLIYDVQGRLITTQVNNSTSTSIDMSHQNVGVYFVKVQTDNGVKVEKILKN